MVLPGRESYRAAGKTDEQTNGRTGRQAEKQIIRFAEYLSDERRHCDFKKTEGIL